MKVVITGGCGFIGQVLAREILQRGDEPQSRLPAGLLTVLIPACLPRCLRAWFAALDCLALPCPVLPVTLIQWLTGPAIFPALRSDPNLRSQSPSHHSNIVLQQAATIHASVSAWQQR